MKLRLMGTSEEVRELERLLSTNQNIEIMESSTEYANRGNSKYVRKYIECKVVIPDVLSVINKQIELNNDCFIDL